MTRPVLTPHSLVVLFLPVVAMIIVASGGTPNAGFFIAFSLFNGILLSGLGFYGFYAGYKYIATGSGRNYSKYLLIQVILFVLGVVFSASGGLNMNGFGNYDRAIAANNGISDFWAATAIIEGILWTFYYIMVGYHIYLSHQAKGQAGKLGGVAGAQNAASAAKNSIQNAAMKQAVKSSV